MCNSYLPQVVRVGGICYVAGMPPKLADVAISTAVSELRQNLPDDVVVSIDREIVPEPHVTGKGFGLM